MWQVSEKGTLKERVLPARILRQMERKRTEGKERVKEGAGKLVGVGYV